MILTSEVEWDPSILDLDIDDDQEWFDAISDDPDCPSSRLFDEYGDYIKRININLTSLEDHVDLCAMYHSSTHVSPIVEAEPPDDYHEYYDASPVTVENIIQYEVQSSNTTSKPIHVSTSTPDYEKQLPLFAWLPTETIRKTYELTSQYTCLPMSTLLKKRYQSLNPALNDH